MFRAVPVEFARVVRLSCYVPVASEVACCEITVLVRSVHVFGKFENQLLTCLKFVRIVLLLYACVCVFM